MNIEAIARLIESSDVSAFRTLSAVFLPMIGLTSADFCDGSYDGGKDFTVADGTVKGVKIGVQLSVESDWRKKIKTDATKTKNNFGTNLLYFISSRRIPEASFESFRDEIQRDLGVAVTKYDSQAIASRFIKNNKVSELLTIFGIARKDVSVRIEKYLGAKNEAISAFLLFGQESKDFQSGLFESMVKSVVCKKYFYVDRQELIQEVSHLYALSDGQGILVNSCIDRLIQRKEIISSKGMIKLSDLELNLYNGLAESSRYEARVLLEKISDHISSSEFLLSDDCKEILAENYLELTIGLIDKSFNVSGFDGFNNEPYKIIYDLLVSHVGQENTTSLLNALAGIVSDSEFAKHIASARLYEILLNLDSKRLINAFGGSESLHVYIDSSVAIPIICGLLFEPTKSRFSQSGEALYRLIGEHEFSAKIPRDYVEELSAHLIEACRDYKYILESGVDLSYSENAFVSHYSYYVRGNPEGEEYSFSEYVSVFGVSLDKVPVLGDDQGFFVLRDRIIKNISGIFHSLDSKLKCNTL